MVAGHVRASWRYAEVRLEVGRKLGCAREQGGRGLAGIAVVVRRRRRRCKRKLEQPGGSCGVRSGGEGRGKSGV